MRIFSNCVIRLPFLVAAELEKSRQQQFLCPVVGESVPRLERGMCSPSYVSHRGKTLRMGIMGIPPYFLLGPDGDIMGTNIMLTHYFAQRLDFEPELVPVNSYNAAEDLVCLPQSFRPLRYENNLTSIISVQQQDYRLLCV